MMITEIRAFSILRFRERFIDSTRYALCGVSPIFVPSKAVDSLRRTSFGFVPAAGITTHETRSSICSLSSDVHDAVRPGCGSPDNFNDQQRARILGSVGRTICGGWLDVYQFTDVSVAGREQAHIAVPPIFSSRWDASAVPGKSRWEHPVRDGIVGTFNGRQPDL